MGVIVSEQRNMSRQKAAEIFAAIGFPMASNWTTEKLGEKLPMLRDLIDPAQEIKPPEIAKRIENVLAFLDGGGKLVVVDAPETPAPVEPEKKTTKPRATKPATVPASPEVPASPAATEPAPAAETAPAPAAETAPATPRKSRKPVVLGPDGLPRKRGRPRKVIDPNNPQPATGRKKKPSRDENGNVIQYPARAGIRETTKARAYFCGEYIAKHGIVQLEADAVAAIDALYVAAGGKSNIGETRFAYRYAAHAVRGYRGGLTS